MSLSIIERELRGVVVLEVVGDMTSPHRIASHLVDRVGDCLKRGRRGILVNLRAVSACDSDGVQALIESQTHVHSQNGRLGLVALAPRVHHALDITARRATFATFDAVSEAVEWARRPTLPGPTA